MYRGTAVSRPALAGLMMIAAASFGPGCAKDATAVTVTIDADARVPPILILRTAVARADDLEQRASSDRSSPYASDAADRPGPFIFPLSLSLTVDASFAGPVVVTVQGLDWETHAVTASGVGNAVVVAQQMTQASLTLIAVAIGTTDGGRD
jgi:hypothetical protein